MEKILRVGFNIKLRKIFYFSLVLDKEWNEVQAESKIIKQGTNLTFSYKKLVRFSNLFSRQIWKNNILKIYLSKLNQLNIKMFHTHPAQNRTIAKSRELMNRLDPNFGYRFSMMYWKIIKLRMCKISNFGRLFPKFAY